MTSKQVEPRLARKMGILANVNIFGLLAVANLLGAVLAWVGYAQRRDAAAGIPAGMVTVLCLIFGAAYFHQRISASGPRSRPSGGFDCPGVDGPGGRTRD